MTLINTTLNWIQNGEPVTGGDNGDSSGVTNRPMLELLENDTNLDERVSWIYLPANLKTLLASLLTNTEINASAAIAESKLDLLFRGYPRPGGGTYSTTAEMAQDINAYANYLRTINTEASLKSLADIRRSIFAGSGFEEFGRHNSAASVINQGMYVYDKTEQAAKGFISFGLNSLSSTSGTSNTRQPYINANGYQIRLDDGRMKNGAYYVLDYLPPVPSSADLPNRVDFAFIEVWTEDVSLKDFIYPFGNTQFLANSWSEIPCVAGSFSGFETYSLYGNWQASSAVIGKGVVWSTLSDANKKKFIDNRSNNLYLTEDGSVIQVRYRVRIVQGIGTEWADLDFLDTFGYDASNKIVPKGQKTEISADLSSSLGKYYPSASGVVGAVNPTTGCWVAVNSSNQLDSTTSFDYDCFAIPLFCIARRNTGAFHPVWNPLGSAKCLNVDNLTDAYWYSTNRLYESTADCFTYKTGGNIGSLLTGRDCDELFYDTIHERDIKDLRSSIKVADFNTFLDREFFKLLRGENRGFAGLPQIKPTVSALLSEVSSGTIPLMYVTATKLVTENLTIASVSATDKNGVAFIAGKSGKYYRVVQITVTEDTTTMYLDPKYGVISEDFTVSDGYSGTTPISTYIIPVTTSNLYSKTLQYSDIIGDPLKWTTNATPFELSGCYGYPLLENENGNVSYIPSLLASVDSEAGHKVKVFKLSQRVKNTSNVRILMKKVDNSWYSHTYNFAVLDTTNIQSLVDNTEVVDRGCSFSPTLNTVAVNFTRFVANLGYSDVADMEENVVIIFTYEAEASPFYVNMNYSETLALNNVFISNIANDNLTKFLIGKVSEVPSSYSTVNEAVLYNFRRFSSTKITGTVRHLAIDSAYEELPMVKVWPVLAARNGYLTLIIVYKEVTSVADDSGEFTLYENAYKSENSTFAKIGMMQLNTLALYKE